MFLKKGSIGKSLYPAGGGNYTGTISLGKKVKNLYIVMNGFEMNYGDLSGKSFDNKVQDIAVNLSVIHTNGTDMAEIRCKFRLNDDNVSGDSFYALCDYVLIGEVFTTADSMHVG